MRSITDALDQTTQLEPDLVGRLLGLVDPSVCARRLVDVLGRQQVDGIRGGGGCARDVMAIAA